MAWAVDKLAGNEAELRVAAYLMGRGERILRIADDLFPDFDLLTDRGSYEVKRDTWAPKTGQAFVELTYKGQPSGLSTTKADWWCQVVGDKAWLIPVRDFREWIEKHPNMVREAKGYGDGKQSDGVFINLYLWPKIFGSKEVRL